MRQAKQSFVMTKIPMLQQIVQPATKIKEDYVVTKKKSVTTQSSVSVLQDNKIMSLQQTHATMRNFIVRKEIIVVTKVEKNHKKVCHHIKKKCCNKLEELEVENSIVTKENYVATKR